MATACLTDDGTVSQGNDFTDGDTVPAAGSATWTISSFSEKPARCAVRHVGASGFQE